MDVCDAARQSAQVSCRAAATPGRAAAPRPFAPAVAARAAAPKQFSPPSPFSSLGPRSSVPPIAARAATPRLSVPPAPWQLLAADSLPVEVFGRRLQVLFVDCAATCTT